MANDKPIKVGDLVVESAGHVHEVKAIDGEMIVLQGIAYANGQVMSGKMVADRRKVKLQKVSTAFVNTLKGTP